MQPLPPIPTAPLGLQLPARWDTGRERAGGAGAGVRVGGHVFDALRPSGLVRHLPDALQPGAGHVGTRSCTAVR